jgi:CHAD domain-containing protein/CYTH domain-containing protein
MKSIVTDKAMLRDPVDRGVRLVAISLLEDAQKAAEKLTGLSKELRDGSIAGNEALHDFRVSIRRLRSWARAFKPWLSDDLRRKDRRRLSGIAEATRTARDVSVHLEWLHEQRSSLSAQERVGLTWLSERLDGQRSGGTEVGMAAVTDFAPAVPKLTRRLNSYRAAVREPDGTARFGTVFAERLLKEGGELRTHLGALHGFTDIEQAHRARMAAKNLRYVAEPLLDLIRDGGAMIATLKALQDSLGDLHDVHILADELVAATENAAGSRARRVSEGGLTDDKDHSEDDPGPGLLALARLLHERGTTAYAELERDWLNDAGAPFFERVSALAADLARRSSRGDVEIERKFLLKRLPMAAADAPSVEIEQGYLPGEKLVERLRRIRFADGAEKWFRTVKAGNGLERIELEEEADTDLSRAMWQLTQGRRLHKRRYSIRQSDDLVWEIDEFLDRELVLAEIELPTAGAVFELPPWLQDVLDREVTDEPDYSNARLARSPREAATTKEAGDGARRTSLGNRASVQ